MHMTKQDGGAPRTDTMKPEEKTLSGGKPVYDSGQLFKGTTEIGIHHDGAFYRLKITRQGKLILNK